eukprot:TRINITY_DN21224_c0_g1_i1.p1 TRINITY_DN21224_c0_g1~~TRINITY_DN21224_c0_g1_i1.p1  ORF type:complete len:578 (-),score=59.35 TRINITY_DN21224_c0_g1_i1:1083-2816(-)
MSGHLWGVKVQTDAREQEEKRQLQRKRAAIVLCEHFLQEFGYRDSVLQLQAESGVSLDKYCVADNVDMLHVLQQYEEYFQMKFSHPPKFYRTVGPDERSGASGGEKTKRRSGGAGRGPMPSLPDDLQAKLPALEQAPPQGEPKRGARKVKVPSEGGKGKQKPTAGEAKDDNWVTCVPLDAAKPVDPGHPSAAGKKGSGTGGKDMDRASSAPGGALQVRGGGIVNTGADKACVKDSPSGGDDFYENRLLKPLPGYAHNSELRELAATIQRDILMTNPEVSWEDVVSLEECKQLLREAVVAPLKYPQFFTGILRPWRGVLLFGPPGTGKTMLAKAVATQCKTTFFNVAASTLVSKWRGDSEKLIRTLFELARYHAPSTIFIDEVDSVMSKRTSSGTEHEGSRRMKTELLCQMDGLAQSSDMVFVLAASNLPWDLDPALLRRLEKRIHVPLPNHTARVHMFKKNLDQVAQKDNINFNELAKATEGYSGADVHIMCREAVMRTLRKKMARLESLTDEQQLKAEAVALDPITMADLRKALKCTKAAGSVIPTAKYEKWEQEFGSGLVLDYESEEEDNDATFN